MTKIMEADILDAGLSADLIPQWEIVTERPTGLQRRRKNECTASCHTPFDDGSCFSIEKHRSRSGFAVAEPETGTDYLSPLQTDDFVLSA